MIVAAGFILGYLTKVIILILYNSLTAEAKNIASDDSEFMKQIKLRYVNQIKLNVPINDAGKFASRYLYQFSKKLKIINIFNILGLIFILLSILANIELNYYKDMDNLLFIFIYMLLDRFVMSERRENIIIHYISDYLANNMINKMAVKEHRAGMRENKEKEQEKEQAKKEEIPMPKGENQAANLIKLKVNSDENEIIKEILEEYLF